MQKSIAQVLSLLPGQSPSQYFLEAVALLLQGLQVQPRQPSAGYPALAPVLVLALGLDRIRIITPQRRMDREAHRDSSLRLLAQERLAAVAQAAVACGLKHLALFL